MGQCFEALAGRFGTGHWFNSGHGPTRDHRRERPAGFWQRARPLFQQLRTEASADIVRRVHWICIERRMVPRQRVYCRHVNSRMPSGSRIGVLLKLAEFSMGNILCDVPAAKVRKSRLGDFLSWRLNSVCRSLTRRVKFRLSSGRNGCPAPGMPGYSPIDVETIELISVEEIYYALDKDPPARLGERSIGEVR